MSKYFLRFFIYLVLFTMLAGIVAGFLPNIVGQVLTAFPYLIAMILVLFKFIRNEQRAPTQMERNRFSLIFVLIFFLYNYVFAIFGPLIFNFSQSGIFELWLNFVSQSEFQLMLISRLLIFMIPFYLISFWFYGKQADRMAKKMFG
ncbi:ABZJ_00895 family protein [Acinetobacter sp. SFB]|uniref:ABZJ_00895 family protein n=1 Tax=Acinetobacter sp. SFB TaxID=1805634 RepID=UPI000831DA96|nr:ABZJ_00895 family protein [Acinetobacter sp. SFB]